MKLFKQFIYELSISKANDFAANAHLGQIRKSSGEPYFTHPTAVYKLLKSIGVKDRNILIAALLHDTIEDSSTSMNDITRNFNKDVAKIVKGLSSSEKGINKYGKPKYLAHKMIKMDNNVLIIKLADRWHNLQDMNDMPKLKAKSYLLQTKYIIEELRDNKNLNSIQKKLVRKIEKTLRQFKDLM
jgi:(p)ppGpp synthase/HD superfamily hydrolase